MPRFDGTGPNGEGRMTGRARGNCRVEEDSLVERTKEKVKTFEQGNFGYRRGFGKRGEGRGFYCRREARGCFRRGCDSLERGRGQGRGLGRGYGRGQNF